jgi:hypothetical protein
MSLFSTNPAANIPDLPTISAVEIRQELHTHRGIALFTR